MCACRMWPTGAGTATQVRLSPAAMQHNCISSWSTAAELKPLNLTLHTLMVKVTVVVRPAGMHARGVSSSCKDRYLVVFMCWGIAQVTPGGWLMETPGPPSSGPRSSGWWTQWACSPGIWWLLAKCLPIQCPPHPQQSAPAHPLPLHSGSTSDTISVHC